MDIRKLPMGRCETVDGESVVTRFLLLGPIPIPMDTVYSLRFGTRPAFPLKHSPKSVILAYLRWVVAPLVIMITFVAHTGNGAGPPELGESARLTLLTMAVIWLALIFVTGRVFGREARQRRLLARYVGHCAPPSLLLPGPLGIIVEELEKTWSEQSEGRAPNDELDASASWRDLYPKDVPTRSLPLYYVLCRYDAALTRTGALEHRARLAWKRMEEDWANVQQILAGLPRKRAIGIEDYDGIFEP